MQQLNIPLPLENRKRLMQLPIKFRRLNFVPEIMKYPCNNNTSILDLYEKSMGQLQLKTLNLLIKSQQEDQNIVCIAGTIDMMVNLDTNSVTTFTVYDTTRFCKGTDYKIIVYNVIMSFTEFGQRTPDGHGTALVIDRDHKTIELFDPTGIDAPWHTIITNKLSTEFNRQLIDYKFVSNEYCPDLGDLEGEGICGAYALLFIILKIYNYDLLPGEIEKLLLSLSQEQLSTFMKQFLCYLDDIAISNNLYDLLAFTLSLKQYVNTVRPDISNELYILSHTTYDLQSILDFANKNSIPLQY